MPEAILALGAFERTGGVPTYCVNAYPEEVSTPSGPKFELRARLGMSALVTAGSGDLRGIHYRDGLFSNVAHVVSGMALYSVTAAGVATAYAGSVEGSGLVDMDSDLDADLNARLWIATGSALLKAQDGLVQEVPFPEANGAGASSVCTLLSFVFATEAGTDKVYFLGPGETTWDPLSFASAEYAADPLVAIRAVGSLLALLGSSTFEPWDVSSGTPEPFGGLRFDKGCRSRDTARVVGNTLVFVDNFCGVQKWEGGELVPIDNPGLVELIGAEDAGDLAAATAVVEGREFYILHLGESSTWVHDLTGPPGRWLKWESPDLDYWRAKLICQIGDTILATDATTAQIWSLSPTTRNDGSDQFAMRVSAIIPGGEKPTPVANMVLIAAQGDAPREGQGSEPQVQVRWTDDDGGRWTGWKARSMGATGETRKKPRWNACGTIPANCNRIVEILVSDPIVRVIRGLKVNV